MNFISRMLSDTAIGIINGSAKCLKGKLMSRDLSDISDLAREAGVLKGEIWIGGNGRIRFSSGIPKSIHQRMRNILASR